MTMSDSLDQQCVDTLRFLSVDMVQKADSGHPSLPLGAAPMAYTLWARHPKHHPANPQWPIVIASCFQPVTVRRCFTACCI
jgi:transketolase